MAARREGHSMDAPVYNDPEYYRRVLEEKRRTSTAVTFWRQVFTVSAAAQRARTGDRTAARRMAWRDLVLKGRRHAAWLLSRYKAHERALAKLLREELAAGCVACARRIARIQLNRGHYLAEITELPRAVRTYADYCHRDGHAANTVDETLDRAGLPTDDAAVTTLVSLAREDRESDFRWLAASRGVPEEALDVMWRETRARLRKAPPPRLVGVDGGRT